MTLAELRAQLDALYDRIATLEHVAASNKRHVQAIVPDLERAEATIARVRAHVEGVAGTTAAGASDYDIGSYELACAVLAALDGLDGPEPEDNGTMSHEVGYVSGRAHVSNVPPLTNPTGVRYFGVPGQPHPQEEPMYTPITPLFTTTAPDWEQAEAVLSGRTSGAAYVLENLTTVLDAELHHVVLDPETRTIWCASYEERGWVIDQFAPMGAAEMFSNQINLVQDWQDDPDISPIKSFNEIQDILDEYTEILRLALPADPRDARQHIQRERQHIARQDALWKRTYAEMVRELVGPDRGGKAKAAEVLGITDVQVGRIIREDDQRRAALAAKRRGGPAPTS